jgi:tetratricopeptide (TPR) repeat protein
VPSDAQTSAEPGTDRRRVITELEAQLARTPRALRPYEHAALAYRLGLAHAEAPVGNPEDGLRKALSYFDTASAIFDPRQDPVEHARVLNGSGAARRALGDRRRAAALFERASELLEGKDRDDERAGVLNNLGLVRSELGLLDEAIEACDAAVDLFDTSTAEGRRGRVAALHSRGSAQAAKGTDEGLEAALVDFRLAATGLDAEEAPYHHGLVHHSIGVTYTALAARHPQERARFLADAIEAFEESLTVFMRTAFPFQHALVKHNLGLAWSSRGGLTNLRRALASFEDAVAMFDSRVHADAWRQSYASLERSEKELEALAPGLTRADHFAGLLAVIDVDERRRLVRERLLRLLALPVESRRRSAVTELALASARLPYEEARAVMEAELSVLIELPPEHLEPGLRARFDANRRLETEEARERADRALDQAVGDALQGPQRISVRDYFYSLGWERP